ncbi:hypothetical protein CONPUDRAFT_89976 [Coniophora puteana RWD-64-598 SS2]|uniref:Uncharacterized protein n=1 Tax=Coniophora puteana (strain RWD-64-598) TaxID=741705 RepID=A0A5M3MP05_CONPW|nr:uncharacterized protein CONPUDRAFT_89976 [Coniophora puteana RWD-64-598 SS2]EIW80899.1 hypothetical protein CONPUDRAFT_89976 [Coniophora puteana RWD-64-598 SS2]
MAAASKAGRSLRIIALPLTRPKAPLKTSANAKAALDANRMLVYYHFNIVSSASDSRQTSKISQYVNKATTKVAAIWADFGKAPEDNWKFKLYKYGERLSDRIDFEELALKGVDPSLGPSLAHPDVGGKEAEKIENDSPSPESLISIIYPPSTFRSLGAGSSSNTHPVLEHLRDLLATREPRHRKGFWTWTIIAPFTAPFAIIPVIPNLPFFFCAWRAWSHYRAYRSSQYLKLLLEHGMIVPQESAELDEIYATTAPSPESTHDTKASSEEEPLLSKAAPPQILLDRKAIPRIVELFGLPESSSTEMYRAAEQVRLRLEPPSQ